MSTLKVDAIRHNSATSDAITTHSDGTASAKIIDVGGGPLSNRNLCINGADMMVAQRGTSTTGLQNTGGVYTIDRFAHRRGGTWANAEWKDEQVNSGTGLFKKALKKTTTTAEGSAASSGKYVMIGYYLEVQDSVAAFGDGTAEAKSFTVSFYVKASIATTYCLPLATSHLITQKAYMKPFTVNNPNTWERKTCTFPALTNSIGTVNGSDNGTGLRFHWVLDAPTGGNPANTWYTHTNPPTSFTYPPGQSPSGYANTLNATFELGGVQIEAGTVATQLEHRRFGDELRSCQRYYEKSYPQGIAPGAASYYSGSFTRRDGTASSVPRYYDVNYKVVKRTTPNITLYNPTTGGSASCRLDSGSYSAAPSSQADARMMVYSNTGSVPSHYGIFFHYTLDAEL